MFNLTAEKKEPKKYDNFFNLNFLYFSVQLEENNVLYGLFSTIFQEWGYGNIYYYGTVRIIDLYFS